MLLLSYTNLLLRCSGHKKKKTQPHTHGSVHKKWPQINEQINNKLPQRIFCATGHMIAGRKDLQGGWAKAKGTRLLSGIFCCLVRDKHSRMSLQGKQFRQVPYTHNLTQSVTVEGGIRYRQKLISSNASYTGQAKLNVDGKQIRSECIPKWRVCKLNKIMFMFCHCD